jgi:hypothetical protein
MSHIFVFMIASSPNFSIQFPPTEFSFWPTMSSSNSIQVLTPSASYGIVIGVGAFFALIMLGITYLQNRLHDVQYWSE